jgi:hypothetical protein
MFGVTVAELTLVRKAIVVIHTEFHFLFELGGICAGRWLFLFFVGPILGF